MNPQTGLKPAAAPAPTIDLDPHRLEFGKVFAPLWVTRLYKEGAWQPVRLESMENINLHPAALVLHYGQAVFEGLKAYQWDDGSVHLFRAIENARRFNRSAIRMAMPTIDEAEFLESIKLVVDSQRDWIPKRPGSLYLRPVMIATEPCIGVRAAHDFLFFVMALPSGAYFSQTAGQSGAGAVKVFLTSTVGRAAEGGTGNVKAAANYAVTLHIISEAKSKGCPQVLFLDAASHQRIEEMGGMNVFFISGRKLITPRLTGTILPGVTRDSIVKLAPSLGFEVEETEITLDDLRSKIKKGIITEAFACGTAAVIVGIQSLLLDTGEDIKLPAAPGPSTSELYERLTGIQYGQTPDPFGWTVKI